MRTPTPQLIALLLACPALLVGCNHSLTKQTTAVAGLATPDAADGLAFHPDQYALIHQAAVDVLHDHGFRIARNDYRFGVITTEPKEAPTAVEFWIDDATTPAQHRSDTLNAQQRSVIIRINPVAQSSKLTEARSPEGEPVYYLTVEVMVQRLQRPARYLTHSATTRISADYAAVPTQLRDRGIDGPYAQPLTRDPQLEARLMNAIALKARDLTKADALLPAESAD